MQRASRRLLFFFVGSISWLTASVEEVSEPERGAVSLAVSSDEMDRIVEIRALQWQQLERNNHSVTDLFHATSAFSASRAGLAWHTGHTLDAHLLASAMAHVRNLSKSAETVLCKHTDADLDSLRVLRPYRGALLHLSGLSKGPSVTFFYACAYFEAYNLYKNPEDLKSGLTLLTVGILRNHRESMLALATILEYAPPSIIPVLRNGLSAWHKEGMMRRLRLASNRVIDSFSP